MDKTLSFGAQVEDVTHKVKKRTSLLRAAVSRDWGWHKKTLRRVFQSTQRSVMDYAAPGWQPFLSSTNMNKLEKAQNQALTAITGQYSSTPLEALSIESGFQSYATDSKRLTDASQQKAFRLPTEYPRALALSSTVPRRLKRSSWKPRLRNYSQLSPTNWRNKTANNLTKKTAMGRMQCLKLDSRGHHSWGPNQMSERNDTRCP